MDDTNREAGRLSLFWRIFLLNATVLVVAAAFLLGPWVTVSRPVHGGEALVVVVGVLAMLTADALLFHVGLAPLKRLSRAMVEADLLAPGERPRVTGRGELAELTHTFNFMLSRLETERAMSAARVLSAQEEERRRVARELHDEVGQTLTAVLLQLNHLGDRAPASLRDEIHDTQEATRDSLDEIRRIARRLRPGVLEDLGLPSGLRALAGEFTTPQLAVHHHIDQDLPQLAADTELALYRVAQEAFTNAARHSGARTIDLVLRRRAGAVELLVRDDGRGADGSATGSGIRGMQERALLLGGHLAISRSPLGGTEVRLRLPSERNTTP